MIEICNLCKLLSNPLRLDMLVRVYSDSDGANVASGSPESANTSSSWPRRASFVAFAQGDM